MYGLLTHNDPHLPQVFSPNARNIPYIHRRLVKQPFTSFSLGGIKWQDFSHVFPTLALAPKLEDAEAAGSSPSWGYAMRVCHEVTKNTKRYSLSGEINAARLFGKNKHGHSALW